MLFDTEEFNISIKHLQTKKDSCGVDGIFISEFAEYWELNKERIMQQVSIGKYKPDAVQLEQIVVRNGKKRLISKYTCTDRVILDVLKRHLTPMFDSSFSEYSYAYRENKGVLDAVQHAARLIEQGNKYVAEIDVKDFFEHINLQRLESFFNKKIEDDAIKKLLHNYLYTMIIDDGKKPRKTIGLIQGSPVSPLLSNVYMAEFDKHLENKYQYCRFSDNINVYCKSEEEARAAYEDVVHYLRAKLGLNCNDKKSGVFPAISRSFLGYDFRIDKDASVRIQKHSYQQPCYYQNWHSSSIRKIDQNYHIINDGILNRRDYTILFENEEHKMYIPVETCESINVYSNVMHKN